MKTLPLTLLFSLTTFFNATPNHPIILLQTFGTAKQPGRIVAGNATERGITLQLAEHITAVMNQENDEIKLFTVNPAGNTKKDPLDVLNKINQINKAVVIQLTATNSKEAKPSCNLFFRCYNPLTDQMKRPVAPLAPVPLEDVYLLNFEQSKILSNKLTAALQSSANEFLKIAPTVGIPLANMRGIRHPVIQIEVSLNKNSQLEQIGNSIALGIKELLA